MSGLPRFSPARSACTRCHSLGAFVSLFLLLTHPGAECRSSAQDRASPEKPPSTTLSADDLKEQRQKELDAMRRRAEATTVWRIDGGARTRLKLMPEPLFRYSDQPRKVGDATLWGFGAKGRPQVLEMVESYRIPGAPQWMRCLTSLSEGLIEAEWRGGEQWSATRPGLELRVLPSAPKLAAGAAARLRQVKEAARRFAATIKEPHGQEEMRLQPQPFCRYADTESCVQDGAIFAFSTNGTNPDLLLVIEIHGKESGESVWKYGLARMTLGQLSVRLDGKDTWSAAYVPPQQPAKLDTWLFFWDTAPDRTEGVRP